MENTELDNLRRMCWNTALHSFGYSYLFQKRYTYYKRCMQFLMFAGLGIPLIIGGLALTFGLTQFVINTALAIGLIQLILSFIAVVYKIDDAIIYSHKSSAEHMALSHGYRTLASNDLIDTQEFKHKYEILEIRREIISYSDLEQKISDKELRRAHRAGLREFSRECIECKKVPYNMNSTECNVCGKFSLRD